MAAESVEETYDPRLSSISVARMHNRTLAIGSEWCASRRFLQIGIRRN